VTSPHYLIAWSRRRRRRRRRREQQQEEKTMKMMLMLATISCVTGERVSQQEIFVSH